jgi:hypothetical protein
MMGMKPPQFSLPDLLWTVGLLAMSVAGIGIVARAAMGRLPEPETIPTWCRLLMLLMVWQTLLSLCAGVAAPFRRKRLGLWIGWTILTLGCIAAPFLIVD